MAMSELMWFTAGLFAVGASYARMGPLSGDLEHKAAAGAFAVVTWGVFMFGSFSVHRGGEVYSSVALAVIGAIGALVMLADLLMLATQQLEVS